MNEKFNKQFFWLFAIIGFFLSIFLFVNEFFLNQIASDRFNLEMQMCAEALSECNLDVLVNMDLSELNANQLKLIELNTIIENYRQYIIKVLQIFFAFIFIGIIPYLIGLIRGLLLRKNKII
ncbi:MAG: hypothetical protein HOF49_02855 [Nitrosomonadales bacterium]|jgi:hypothetical protein|nr:hypothetical protein [Nitrosomonadales bacterium]MBT3918497.1 hypothetical protein [Nitrosomonadales bacterium]MBT4571594.1 hypothetical protein [Nitrosomonadales bacterium]MBT4759391.1 hypothetical protein [Nitrosomonadales bacterium]MBT6015412.1 hypothetical protein [Nitrosomonadales bacterium]